MWTTATIKTTVTFIVSAMLIAGPNIALANYDDFSFKSDYKPKSTFWRPLLGYIAPGSAQYVYGQDTALYTYAGLGLAGFVMANSSGVTAKDLKEQENLIELDNTKIKQLILGSKTYELAGQMSMYHAFRTAAANLQSEGAYRFLGAGETTPELMLAPFEFSHLRRWTTIIPVGFGASIFAAVLASKSYRPSNAGNFLYTSTLSYEAGVGEEMMFRGWIHPLLYQNLNGSGWANAIQAGIFGVAHLSKFNRAPVFQFLFGYYMGWLVERNHWSLSEAVFIHTWWDVMVFAASQSYDDSKASIQVPLYWSTF